MAELTPEEQAAADAKAAEEQAAADTKAAEEQAAADAAEFGDDFDKDRALATIRKQREAEAAAEKRAKDAEAELKTYRDAEKTDQEKLAEGKATAEKEAADARNELTRLRVAMKYELDEEDLDLLGTGTEEQIEARAKRLAERGSSSEGEARSGRPRERLKPGAVPSAEVEETDPRKLAQQIRG